MFGFGQNNLYHHFIGGSSCTRYSRPQLWFRNFTSCLGTCFLPGRSPINVVGKRIFHQWLFLSFMQWFFLQIEYQKQSEIPVVLLYFALWLVQKTRPAFSTYQSDAKLEPITNWSLAFSRAFGCFNLSSHWLFKLFSFLLRGRCDYLSFGVTTLDRKEL